MSTTEQTTSEALAAGWLADVDAAMATRDWAKATRLAERALALGFEHARFLHLRAAGRAQAGQNSAALADLERAHELDPADPGIGNALGVALIRAGDPRRALAVLAATSEAEPALPITWVNLGAAHLALGDPAAAEAAYQQAVTLDPTLAPAWGRLAVIASNRGDADEARRRAGRALALDPHDPDGRRAAIEADLDQGQPEAAEQAARAWLTAGRIGPNGKAHALGLLGDALDAQGRFDAAFAAYAAGKAEFGRIHAPRYRAAGQPSLPTIFRTLKRDFQAIAPARWRSASGNAAGSGPRTHVFLMGFMRSGTTLLEQALSRHPDVVGLEETEALAHAGADYLVQPEGLSHIADVSTAEADRWRVAYWSAVGEAGVDPAGKVFIDKLPFNAVKLPLIAKLFPDAKIIFAVRDPRDVVLSCFQRRFQPNAYTFEMHTLAGAAELYASYMELAAAYRAGLPLDLFEHRHEALVADVGAAVSAVCRFIDLDFRPELTAFGSAARSGQVLSQSARQLGQGLNTKGVARWRDYTGPMATVHKTLAPWVTAYGYASD